MIQKSWFAFVCNTIQLGLFFYSKKITVSGRENIPKKGAVLFAVNHPNGLVDPLYVTTTNRRRNHFLVRAASFKKPFIKKILESLNLMPIYRIRDGIQQLANNQKIFERCFKILHEEETLMIFPEGSHDKKRTVRNLSKGFTRIVSGALEKHPELEIQVVPVGITYQHASDFPSKVVVRYGQPIATRTFFEANAHAKSINILKAAVTAQLKELSVHIPNDENYEAVLQQLNDAQVDFTQVDQINKMIEIGIFPKPKKKKKNFLKPVLYLIKLNSIFPFLIWKTALKKIDEIEFIDTFRFSLHLGLIPIFYGIQAWIIGAFYGTLGGLFYLTISALLILIYVKCAPTNTKAHVEFNI
jgi:1-acyl-sn-glycerol-3-phosphate acyltransferase